MVGVSGMTVAFQIAIHLDMPLWLEAMEMISPEQWLAFNQCLSFAATVGLY